MLKGGGGTRRRREEGRRRGSTGEREIVVMGRRGAVRRGMVMDRKGGEGLLRIGGGGQEEEGREVEVINRNGCGCMCAWVRTCCLVLFLLLARARDNIVDSKNETSTAFKKRLRNYVRK